MGDRNAGKSQASQRRRRLDKPRLEALIAEATVDAYGESEELGGLYTMIDEHEIVAICSRGRLRQPLPILDLVLPSPAPAGAEWIEAYRYWAGRR